MKEKNTNCLIIISYNQEKYVEKCFDSINKQKIKPEKIYWFDDNSTDKTIKILNELIEENNEIKKIIKININKENIGIYENLNQTIKDWKCDFVHYLACDDWFESENYFKDFDQYCDENKIKSELPIYITSNHLIFKNDKIEKIVYEKEDRNISGIIRGKYTTRNLGISNGLMKKFDKYDTKIGVWADKIFEVDAFIKSEKNLHMEGFYHCYRASVGVSSKTKSIDLINSELKALENINTKYLNILERKDKNYIKYQISKNKIFTSLKIKEIINYTILYFKNINNKIEIKDPLYIIKYHLKKLQND